MIRWSIPLPALAAFVLLAVQSHHHVQGDPQVTRLIERSLAEAEAHDRLPPKPVVLVRKSLVRRQAEALNDIYSLGAK